MITAKLRVRLSKLRRLQRDLRDGGATSQNAVRQRIDALENAYRRFIVRRFDTLSRGGSWDGQSWPKLAESTKKRKKSRLILVSTRFMRLMLFASLKVVKRTKDSIVFRFVNATRHPDSDLTVGELLEIHDKGHGVPQRQILVEPDAKAAEQMRQDLRTIGLR